MTNPTSNTPKEPTKANTVAISGRVQYDTYRFLFDLAKADKRTIGFYVSEAVEEYAAKLKAKAYPPDKP